MKLDKKTEKALLMGAALLFVLLLCIAIALLISPEKESAEPVASAAPTATAAPQIKDGITIGGKLTDRNTDTFYLHKVILSDEDKANISALTNLRTLSLTDCTLTEIGFLTPLTGLTTLYLSKNYIADLSPLAGMTGLRTLYLDGNPLNELKTLYSLTSLQTLSLQSVPLTASTLEALQIALPNCKIFDDAASGAARPLTLGGMSFTAEDTELYLSSRGISDISILSQCSKLRILDLSGNPLEGVGALKQLSSLQTLNLASTGLTDSEARIVMGIRSLTWLNISDNSELSGEVIDELVSTLSGCEVIHDEPNYKLKLGTETIRSDIEELTMPSARLASIGPLRKCSRLRTVDLSGNYITDLTPLSANTELKSLLLKGNRISSCEGLNSMVMLETLDLSDNQLNDVSALSGCLNLTWLDLSNNNLSFLNSLYTCINLRYLNLSSNPISWETLQAIRQALPLCEIISEVLPPMTEAPVQDPAIVFPQLPEGNPFQQG